MKKKSKTKALIACVVALSFAVPGLVFASSNNNSGSGFDSPTIKIKEFRETK